MNLVDFSRSANVVPDANASVPEAELVRLEVECPACGARPKGVVASRQHPEMLGAMVCECGSVGLAPIRPTTTGEQRRCA